MPDDWVSALIGKPYVPRAKGPDTFDCWGLCCFIWQQHFGIEDLPDVGASAGEPLATRRRFAGAVSAGEAVPIETPIDGCAVYMSRARQPDHIGIYLRGSVLHAMERTGVVFTRLSALPFIGLKVIGLYLPRGSQWPPSTS